VVCIVVLQLAAREMEWEPQIEVIDPSVLPMADLVVSNTSTLNMRRASAGDTGWRMELEVRFTRDPPIYGKGDESIGIESTFMVYPGATAQRVPPIRVGTVVTIRPWINGIQSADIQLLPLLPIADGAASLSTFHHCMLAMEGLRIEGVFPQSITVQIELVDIEWGTLSSQIRFILDAPSLFDHGGPLDAEWPVAPRAGRLGHCLSEIHDDASCWRHIRSRLFGVPIFTTQTELVVLALSSSTFFRHNNTAAFRSQFPRHDTGRAHFRTCALVGSAGHLLNSSLGVAIDAHEMVLRFNEAPIAGYERDVGTRTTHRILTGLGVSSHIRDFIAQSVFHRPDPEELIFVPKYHEFRSGIEEYVYWLARGHGRGVHLFSISFLHFAWKTLFCRNTDQMPTSGFLGLLWAMDSCEQLDTYGMGNYHQWLKISTSEDCERTYDRDLCTSSRSTSDHVRHAYSYFARKTPSWSYVHKWDVEDDLHWTWHREGALNRHFDTLFRERNR